MTENRLRDLELAGVQWELNETPLTITAQNTRTAQATNASGVQDSPVSDVSRPRIITVPPIAPVQTMSVDTAVAMASRPTDPESLLRLIAEFNHPLRSAVTNVVMPNIATRPNGLVIMTDIPGADDDKSGRIMSGATGDLMDKMLMAIGMSRDNVSIVPMLFWRTPGGRSPTRTEIDLSRPFVDKLLSLLSPRVIITMGTLPAQEIGNAQLPRDHGQEINMENGIKLVPIFHPNYLLLKPSAKRDAWNALQNVQKMLKNL